MERISGITQAGERRVGNFLISRILVIISIIVIPILMFLLFSGTELFTMAWLPEDWRPVILDVTPWFFTFGWVFMLLLFSNRISGSIDSFDENIQIIPARYKLFYGLNALALLIIFALPVVTPVICVLAFASAGYRLATRNTDWDNVDKTPTGAVILSIIFALFPLLISVAVMPDMLSFSEYMWNNSWVPVIPVLNDISLALSTALTYGSLVILIQTGASEYENVSVLTKEDNFNKTNIKIFEAFVFALLIFLEWKNLAIKDLFYYAGFGIVCFITLVNFIKGRQSTDFKTYTFGYILTIILYGATILSWDPLGLGANLELIVIMISASAYLLIYVIVFFKYDEND